MSTEEDNPLEIAKQMSEWTTLHQLRGLVAERIDSYVNQLADKKVYLEQYVAVLTAMLDSIGDGLVVVDQYGNLVLINEAGSRVVGSGIPEKIGEPWGKSDFGLFYEDTVTRLTMDDEPMRQALKGKPTERIVYARTAIHPDGRWHRIHATPVYDKAGVLHGAIAVFQDIHDSVQDAKQREALSALITHDIKNHFAGEGHLIRALIEGKFGPLNKQQVELLTLIENDSKRHFKMTNSLVEIMRYDMRASTMQFMAADLKPLIEKFVSELSPAAVNAGLTLTANCDNSVPKVNVDLDALRHVISNFVGNAIKYTPSGGKIVVATRELDGGASITISDTGPGIPEAQLKKLFFEISPDAKEYRKPETSSTGLGMYLCSQIVKAHNGTISCDSVIGSGTTFIVTLPASDAIMSQ